jgi:predicted nucleic acid-binding protein
MENLVLLDAGPFVALINRDDQFHGWTVAQLGAMQAELLSCEAVISECFYLVRHNPVGVSALLAYLEEGIVRLDFSLDANLAAVASLMRKYHDTPMSLADACLVRMSELHSTARVFTLDADFRLYRRNGRQTIPLIYPAP